MELRDPAHPLRPRREECRPEVQCPLLLPETIARHDADTRRIQQSQAVILIRMLARLVRGLDRLLREFDCGEQVHRPLRGLALHALHFLEGVVEGVRAFVEGVVDVVVFLAVQGVGGVAFPRGVDHGFHDALADDGRAEHDGDEFVDLGDDL
jgi:hypothetical protein